MSDLPLPRSVDELPYLFVWRLDDFLLPAVTTALGFVAGAPVSFGLGGFVLAWLYQRYRAGRPELFVVHMIWSASATRRSTHPRPRMSGPISTCRR